MESYQPESYAFKAWLFADLRCSQSSIQTSADGSHLRWAFSQRSAATSTYLGSGDDVFFLQLLLTWFNLVQLGSTWFSAVFSLFLPVLNFRIRMASSHRWSWEGWCNLADAVAVFQ